jgi:lipid-A-disaccharide synthase
VTGGPARVLIVAGEASGDLYGGLLIKAMMRGDQDARFIGVGGSSMRAAGLAPLGDAGAMGVTGVLEVLGQIGAIWKAYRQASGLLTAPGSRPDLVILIDYPDFNLRLARKARAAGVPVLYFVSPQVWAWRKARVGQIARLVDRMLVILPFEAPIYERAGVPVEFVGHPLLDLVRAGRDRRQARALIGLDPHRPTVALLPGSRWNEVRAHLPPMLGAARRLREEFRDLQFLLPVAPTVERAEIERLAGPGGPVLVKDDRYDAVASADAAVVASGTATLETALLGVPMVIVYRMNPVTYALARRLSDVPHVGMPNLIAGERIVPELLQADCREDRIALEVRAILTDPARAEAMRRGFARVRQRLGAPGAIPRVADIAWGMIAARRGHRAA